MSDPRALRIAGWSGIVFSLLSLIVIPLAGGPAPESGPAPALGATAEQFSSWYGQHRTGFLIGNYLGIAAFIPGFVQLAVLAASIRAREDARGWLAGFVLAAGTFTYAVFACSLVAFQALPFLVDPKAPQGMFAMATLGAIWFALDGLAAVPMLLAVGWATLATGALPRWFAHVTWGVTALALLMSAGALVDRPAWLVAGGPATVVGFVAFFVWTFVLGVIFLRRPPRVAGD